MIHILYYLIIICTTIIGANVLPYIGIENNTYYTSIIAISILLMVYNKQYFIKNQTYIYLLLFIFLYSILKLVTDKGDGTRFAVLNIIGAPIIFASFPKIKYYQAESNIHIWKNIYKIILFFYILEIGIAIYERISNNLIFGWADAITNNSGLTSNEFRSTALLGHPLQNALIVSTIMSFILISSIKIKYKLILWSIGYLAIMCFNTRSSMVGNLIMFLIYVGYTFFKDKTSSIHEKKLLLFLSIIILFLGIYLFFYTSLGGRLLEIGLFDEESAGVRINIWNVFNYYPLEYFLTGFDMHTYHIVMQRAGLFSTENFWIDWLFKFGFIFLIPFTLLYLKFIKKLYQGYSHFQKLFTAITFILIASTNNSLSTSFIPLLIYLICIESYHPLYAKYCTPKILSKKFKL